jgi:hypothetical protein
VRAPPALALAALATAGCTDLSVDVVFDVPDDYEEITERVEVDVIAPGEALWQCRDLEFGDLEEAEVGAALVDQAQIGPDGEETGFEQVPRTGLKLFHARGYNALDQLVAAGCATHELVDGEVEVAIEGRPAAYLSARGTRLRGEEELDGLLVGISDARGDPMAGVTARYSVVSANGATPEREAESDEQGSLDLSLDAPPWFGPQVVDIDVPWQANAIEPVTGFRTPVPRFAVEVAADEQVQDLRAEQIYQVGRIGPDGEMGIAVLGPATNDERPVHMFIHEGEQQVPVTAEKPVRASALGLVADGDRDRVLVLNQNGWHEMHADGQVTSHAQSPLAGNARRIIPLPESCDAGAPRDRMLVDDGTGLILLSADLEVQPSPLATPGTLLAAGCMIGNAGVNPAAVVALDDGAMQLMAEIEGARSAPWPNRIQRGISFTPPLADSPGGGPFALGNLVEVDGQSIARHTLVRGPGNRLALDVDVEDEVAGFAVSSTGGDFDGDNLLDVAGLLLVININQVVEARVFVALGATLEGNRLTGQSGALAPDEQGTQRFLDTELIAADLDRDGIDELVLASRNRFEVYSLEP